MEFVVIFLATLVVAYIVLRKTNHKLKQTAVKKEEIIQQYERQLQEILTKNTQNKEQQLQEKKLFLKECNEELSRNIFFTTDEASEIIKKLAHL